MNLRKKEGRSPKFLLVVLTAVCAVLLTLSIFFGDSVKPFKNVFAGIVIPMQEGINSCGEWFGENVGSFKSIKELQAENELLRDRLEALSEENELYKNKSKEVEKLQETVDLVGSYEEYDTIAAKVISNGSGNWYQEFIINKGSKDNIQENMNVVAVGGLVGLVTEVGENYAKVRTIIDDEMSISAASESTSDTCVVSGDYEQMQEDGTIPVTHIAKSAEMSAGDTLVTSHISSKYVEGLTIGTVSDIKMDSNNLSQSAVVTPAVDFLHIEQVLVITQLKTVPDTSETAD